LTTHPKALSVRAKRWRCVLSLCVTCAIASTLQAQAHPTQDCYLHRAGSALLLGNSRLEITIDARSGAITQIRNKTTSQSYLLPDAHGNFRLVYSAPEANGAVSGDPWTAVSGTLIDGSKQHVMGWRSQRLDDGLRLEVSYDSIQMEKRRIKVALRYSIQLANDSEATSWEMSVDNHEPGTIREVHFPFLSGLVKLDNLIMPNHSGQLLRNPGEKMSDEIPNVHVEYPARASMQWFEYFSSRAGLYLAAYDQDLNYKQLFFGRAAAGMKDASMWIVQYPFAVTSTTWRSPELVVGIHAGDWHWGGDEYRRWLRSWVPPSQVSKYVREMTDSDTDVFIKDVDESLVHNYSDAARMALERPLHCGTMFVGWHYNGHDTYYPEYVPIPDLGGKDALTSAIDAIHTGGSHVSAYTNVRLNAIATKTYKDSGSAWAVLNRTPGTGVPSLSGGELREDWNPKWTPARRGEGSHAVMCPSAKGWQDHMVAEVSRIVGEYHFDGVFLDQAGSFYSELCWNKNHGHSNPANAWGPGYVAMLRRIREATRALNPDSYLWIEGMNDVYGQFIDYHLDKNQVWEPMRTHPEAETFAEMWRYSLPDQIIVDDPKSYSYLPSKDPAYGDSYFFVMGIRGYGMLNELAGSSPEQKQIRRAVTDKIRRLWTAGSDYFFYGEFRDTTGLRVSPPELFAKVYRGANGGIAVAAWNAASRPTQAVVAINLRRLEFSETGDLSVTSLDTRQPLPYRIDRGVVQVKLRLERHDIDVVEIRTAK